MNITIIYLEERMLISSEGFLSWREIQDKYTDYKTSLGPWSPEAVIEYLNDEYPKLNPGAENQIKELLNGSKITIELKFNE